jgi:hypothetical protein
LFDNAKARRGTEEVRLPKRKNTSTRSRVERNGEEGKTAQKGETKRRKEVKEQ